MKVVEGVVVDFEVEVSGRFKLILRWFKDGDYVVFDDYLRMDIDGCIYILLIICFRLLDGGRYSCVVFNSGGRESCFVIFKV